jgi:hypothetical protein
LEWLYANPPPANNTTATTANAFLQNTKRFISHKNQEISILMIRKRLSEINTFSTSHKEFPKQRTKDQETKKILQMLKFQKEFFPSRATL